MTLYKLSQPSYRCPTRTSGCVATRRGSTARVPDLTGQKQINFCLQNLPRTFHNNSMVKFFNQTIHHKQLNKTVFVWKRLQGWRNSDSNFVNRTWKLFWRNSPEILLTLKQTWAQSMATWRHWCDWLTFPTDWPTWESFDQEFRAAEK